MKMKHLFLPLMAGMALHATTVTAHESPTDENVSSKALSFIENKGQITDQFLEHRKDIDFKLNGGNGLSIFIGNGKMHYQWSKAITLAVISTEVTSLRDEMKLRSGELSRRRQISSEQFGQKREGISPLHSAPLHSGRDDDGEVKAVASVAEALDNEVAELVESVVIEPVEMYRMDVELIGANPYARIITEGKQSFYERYFLSWVNTNNSNEGVIANAFSKITYKDIYPNIDWVFYFNGKGQLEHDFVVHPGGEVSDIRIKYSGTDALEINPDGSLRATTPMGTVTENAPYAYTVHRAIQEGEEISPLRSAPLHFGRDGGEKLSAHSTAAVISTGAMALRGEMPLRSGEISFEQFGQKREEISLLHSATLHSGRDDGRASVASRASATEATAVVASKFRLDNNILTFEVAPYSGTLVIDPVIEWGTYFGGTGDDAGLGITTDKWGHVYMCGSTNSIANIATVGAHQDTFAGAANDAFLSKWGQDGNLLWATYYGGERVDVASGIACDTFGNVYAFGNTSSPAGIATAGSFQEAKLGTANRFDAYLVKFDSAGQRVWGTYFGGTMNEANTSAALTIDRFNNIYCTGNTQSDNLPVTAGAHQSTYNAGPDDAFIAKFNTEGNLVWCTYYGGAAPDYPYGIDADSSGNIYLTGYTQSASHISTPGAHQFSNAGGQDGFLTKFDSTGRRIWGTYFGGGETDQARAISVGDSTVMIGGLTTSHTKIATANGHQVNIGGGQDGFISAFDLSGQQLWATYYGGSNEDDIKGLWVNEDEIYAVGGTDSKNNISDTWPFNGSMDIYIVKFNKVGERIWSRYVGGTGIDNEPCVAGEFPNIYIAGKTNSSTGISSRGAYQEILNSGYDGLLLKINDCDNPLIPASIKGKTGVCDKIGQIYMVAEDSSVDKYVWILPSDWSGNSDSNSIHLSVGENSGIIRVVAISDCGGISDTQSLEVTVLPLPEPEIVNNNNILSTDQPYASYQWILDGEDIEGATSATHIATKDGDYTVRVTNEDGCEGLSEVEAVTGTVTIQHPDRSDAIGVYPNPAKDRVYVQSDISGFMYLYGMDGRLIKQDIPLSVGINSLKIDDLGMGIYQLQIVTDKGVSVFKIVKTE